MRVTTCCPAMFTLHSALRQHLTFDPERARLLLAEFERHPPEVMPRYDLGAWRWLERDARGRWRSAP